MANQVSMKKIAVALIAGMAAGAAHAATTTGSASATVLTPLSVSETTAMSFGDVGGDAIDATTIVLTTAGGTSSSDGAYVGGTPAAAAFTVSGAASQAYVLTLPGSITLTSGTDTVTVDTLTDTSTGALDVAGSETFSVGGTLNLGANQASGNYTGSYTVTVAY